MRITASTEGTLARMLSRLGTVATALVLALVLPACASAQTPPPSLAPAPAPAAAAARATSDARVLAISVDGLNSQALRDLGPAEAPTFWRLLDEGVRTLNARTEYEQNVTLPNHTSMLTGRRIDRARGGHGVTWDDDRPGLTVKKAAKHPISSVFNVVHVAGGETALFSTKKKFALYQRSWPRAIDRFFVNEDQGALVGAATADLLAADRAFTFLHVSLPDRYGHLYGGMSAQYLDAVRTTDRQLGQLLRAVEAEPEIAAHLTVVLTADHGFAPGKTDHSAKVLANYRIPFIAWGAQVGHGNFYRFNRDYRDPGDRRPTYAAKRQPVRNGDLGNLSLALLGLRPIPGSEIGVRQILDVR